MSVIDLPRVAAQLEQAWRSTRVTGIGAASLKLTRMDAQAYSSETHDYDEALLVLDGELHLELAGAPLMVRAGELCVVPAGVPHAVSAGSRGTLLIVDS